MRDPYQVLGIPSTATDEEVKKMAHGCSYEGTRTIGSFKVCDENDIYEIYKLANK